MSTFTISCPLVATQPLPPIQGQQEYLSLYGEDGGPRWKWI